MTTSACHPVSVPAPAAGTKAAQIMGAATRLFLEHGYGATSMDGIARAATVSKATLYSHFDSKAELFAAMVGTECARAVPALAAPDLDAVPVAEALFRMGCDFLDLVVSPKALAVFRVVVAEAPRFPELGQAFYRSGPQRTLALLSEYLERAHDRGLLSVPEPYAAAEFLWAMIRSHFHLRILLGVDTAAPSPEESRRHVRRAVDLFVRAYAPA